MNIMRCVLWIWGSELCSGHAMVLVWVGMGWFFSLHLYVIIYLLICSVFFGIIFVIAR